MPEARILKVVSNDGKVNVSYATYASFSGKGVPLSVSVFTRTSSNRGGRGFGVDTLRVEVRKRHRTVKPKPPPEALSSAQVEEMLRDTAPWRLLVNYNATNGVLDRNRFEQAWGNELDQVPLRPLQPDEQSLRDSVLERIKSDTPSAWISDALSAPLASVAVVTAALGGFGLAAATVSIARLWLAGVAIACLLAAIGAAYFAKYAKKTVWVKIARLDLIEGGFQPSRRLQVLAWGCVALIVVAIGCGVFAVFPKATESEAPLATIETPSTATTAAGLTATIDVTWKHLDKTAVKVRTAVSSADKQILSKTSSTNPDGTAKQELEATLPGPAKIKVTTEALDAGGKTVGDEISRSFDVP